MKLSAFARLVLVPVLALPASAGVLIVDAKPPAGFIDIQSAVDAASDGDTLLVKSGIYPGFVVVDKDLTIAGDALAQVQIDGTIHVRDLGAEKTVLLAGLDAAGGARFDGTGLRLVDNAGMVWVEGCSIRARASQACMAAAAAAHVERCGRVAIVRSDLVGSEAAPGQGSGGDALHVIDSSVATHNCGVMGGFASWHDCGGAMDGGNGGSSAHVSGASFLFTSADRYMAADGGGAGGNPAAGGNGGDGLIGLAPSQLEVFGSMLLAGAGGLGSECGLPECDDGSPGTAASANVHVIGGEAATFTGGPPVREGMPIMVVVYGIPGERYAFDTARDTDFRFAPNQRGVRLTRGGRRLALGHIPPSGATGVLLTAPMLAPGEQSRRVFVQSLHWGTSGPLTLGSVRAIVVLDAEF